MAICMDDPASSRSAAVDAARAAVGVPSVATVLVVVDDPQWNATTFPELVLEGFACTSDPTGDIAFDVDLVRGFDLAFVDLGLVGRSGLAVCAAIRARSTAPLVATARTRDETTVLSAFSAGADQFTAFDASARQIAARLRSLMRRCPPSVRAVVAPPVTSIVLDDERCAALVKGAVVLLSEQEREVLAVLMARAGRVVSRTELLGLRLSSPRNDRAVDFVIRRLRQKLEAVDGRRRITAIRGVGFRLEVDEVVPSDPTEGA